MSSCMITSYLILFTSFILAPTATGSPLTSKLDVPMQRLATNLLEGYRKGLHPVNSRPVKHPSEAMQIYVGAHLYQIINVDQVMNTIKLTAAFEMEWTDPFLAWQPDDYQNATEIFLPASQIWTPELSLLYSLNSDTLPGDKLEVAVSHDGVVRYFLTFTAHTLCPYEVKLFPFDQQDCVLEFGSLVHTVNTMDLHPRKSENHSVGLDSFYDNQEWMLEYCHLTKDYTIMNGRKHATLFLRLRIKRQSFYYIFNVVIPGAMVTLVAIVGFHVPGRLGLRDSKFHLGLVTLMAMSVLLLGITDDLPKFALTSVEGKRGSFSSVPLLGIYYFSLLTLISMSCITTSLFVLIQRLYEEHKPVPWWLVWLAPCYFWQTRRAARKFPNSCYHCGSVKKKSIDLTTPEKINLLTLMHDGHHCDANSNNGMPLNNAEARTTSDCNGATNSKASNHPPEQVAILLRMYEIHKTLSELKRDLCRVSEDRRPKDAQIWPKILRRLSGISFLFYLFIYASTVTMFFFHDWYASDYCYEHCQYDHHNYTASIDNS